MTPSGSASEPFSFHAMRSPTELARLRLCQLSIEPRAPPANCFSKEYLARERYLARVERQEALELERFLQKGSESRCKGASAQRASKLPEKVEDSPNVTLGQPPSRGVMLLTPSRVSNYKPLSPITSFLSGYPGSPSRHTASPTPKSTLPSPETPAEDPPPCPTNLSSSSKPTVQAEVSAAIVPTTLPNTQYVAAPKVNQEPSSVVDSNTIGHGEEITRLRLCVENLGNTVRSQARLIANLREQQTSAGTTVPPAALSQNVIKRKKKKTRTTPQKMKTKKKTRKSKKVAGSPRLRNEDEYRRVPLRSGPRVVTSEAKRTARRSTFNKGKTGVFERLWSGKKRTGSGESSQRVIESSTMSVATENFQPGSREPFKQSQLEEVARLYTVMAQFSLALDKAKAARCYPRRCATVRRPLFWINESRDCIVHKLTSSSSELARCVPW